MVVVDGRAGRGISAAIHFYTPGERERGLDLLQNTEPVFHQLGAPSALGVALADMVLDTMGVTFRSPLRYGSHMGVVMFGYACRMSQPSPRLPASLAMSIEEQLVHNPDGSLDYLRLAVEPERLDALFWLLSSWGYALLEELLGEPFEVWEVFSRTASIQLLHALSRSRIPRRHRPHPTLMAVLLQEGYFLRCIDEAAGEEPSYRNEA